MTKYFDLSQGKKQIHLYNQTGYQSFGFDSKTVPDHETIGLLLFIEPVRSCPLFPETPPQGQI